MTFLNFALLGGIAAFSIPVIIHLLNRSRFRVVKWGAMHLLEPVLRKNMRRLRIEQILLLIMRAMIPVLLALLMAKPVITGWKSLSGGVRSSMVVLLDSSYSMQAEISPQQTAFDQARTEGEKLIGNLQRQSDVAVLQMGGQVRPLTQPVASTDHKGTRARLRDAAATMGVVDSRRSMDMAVATASQMSHAKREWVIVSDFQRVNWERIDGDALRQVREKIDQLSPRPTLTLMPVGRETDNNIAIERVNRLPRVIGPQQEFKLTVFLKNYGKREHKNVRVRLFVDGEPKSDAVLGRPLAAGESDQVAFHHAFDKPGSHRIRAWAESEGDSVRGDNSFLMAVPVLDRVPVLIVSGETDPAFGKGETDLLEVALQPFGKLEKRDLRDLIDAEIIEEKAFEKYDLSQTRVVILANLPTLTRGLDRLEAFVRGGGGLIVFCGNRLIGPGQAWYESHLYKDGRGLLPARIVGIGGATQGEREYVAVARESYDHPVVEIFKDPRNGNLAAVEMHRWFRIADDALAAGSGRQPSTVVLRLENGDPFIMEKSFGDGRVMVCAGPCDSDWSNLAGMGNIYVPLMQRMVTYLASQVEPERTVDVGRPLVAHFDREHIGRKLPVRYFSAESPGNPRGSASEALPPVAVVARGPRGMVQVAEANRPGLYVIMGPDGAPVHLAVNAPRAESKLDRLSDEEIAGLAEQLGADVVADADAYIELDKQRRYGREVWPILWWAVLLLVFGELLLVQYVTRGRRS